MKVSVQDKKKVIELDLAQKSPTVKDLKEAYIKQVKRISPYRQTYKFEDESGKKAVKYEDDSKALSEYGYRTGMVLRFKDIGPQIGYRTVFVIEYLGPIIIMLLYATRPAFLYGEKVKKSDFSPQALLGISCWIFHFVKRELETFFVHKFSRPTMPLKSLFINCQYYWGFALAIGYFLAHPEYQGPSNELQHRVGLSIFAASEAGNFICHVMLSSLRNKEGNSTRPIPSGFFFNYVSCPNYFFEVLSWVGFSLMTNIKLSYVFTLVGGLQMLDWAQRKHKAYLKSYGDEYKKLRRKAMIPFVI